MWSPVAIPDLNGWIEILCLAVLWYYLFVFLKGTRGAPVLAGLTLVFIGLFAVTRVFRFDALNWILSGFSVYLAVAVIVIFQPEIRHALAELGKRHRFGASLARETLADRLVRAVDSLARHKTGALIAVEQSIGTRLVQETGIRLDSAVTPELLAGLFTPHGPLHDGGVVIADGRIVAARCMFPLTERQEFGKNLGARHRAAIGLSDETDAVVVVVSEETGAISVCHEGRLFQNLEAADLHPMLARLLDGPAPVARWTRLQETGRQVDEWLRRLRERGPRRASGRAPDRNAPT